MRYRTVLAHSEFRALFAAQTLSLLGDQLARIALAILVYRRTGSPLATTATYAISYLTYLVGGPLLSGLADRYSRLNVMVVCDLVRVPLVLGLCVAGLPLWALFSLIGLLGAVAPPFDSARGAIQPDLLTGESYVVGNMLMNVAVQLSQITGFVAGGALVAATSVRGALVIDAATFLLSAGLLLHGVRQRPAAQTERSTLLRDGLAGARLVLSRPDLRGLLLLAVLGSVAVIGTEGLAVLVASELHGGARLAGILTATAPLGYLAASAVILRVDATRRLALMPVLVLGGCVPLLATPFTSSSVVVGALWVVGGAAAAVNLIAGPEFILRCPTEVRARAYGVASTALWTAQAVGLLLAGALANVVTPRQAVAALAGTVLLLALFVVGAQGNSRFVREMP